MAKLVYPEDGWYRFEKFGQLLFLRGIPTRHLMRAGHYHQDVGHFTLHRLGVPILVDGGRRNYTSDEWGRFGLRPEAHNTITINNYGINPDRPTRFPRNYADPKLTITNFESDDLLQIDIQTSGFNRIHPSLNWHRRIQMYYERFEINDVITGINQYLIASFLHFSYSMQMTRETKHTLRFGKGDVQGLFKYEHSNHCQPKLYRGGQSLFGWQATTYGKALEAPTLVFRERIKLPVKYSYKIIWGEA